MAISLGVFRAQVDNLLTADNDILSQLARDRDIKAAVERYSTDAPDGYTEDVTGDAGKYYPVASNFTYWVEGFSRIVEIEYPAADITADEQPQYLEPEDWRDDYWKVVSSVHTRYLYLPNHSPAATEAMRVRYTVPYNWTVGTSMTAVNQATHGFSVDDYVYLNGTTWYEATDARIATHQVSAVTDADNFTAAELQTTVLVGDFFAVCHLAAGLCCHAVAAKYAKLGHSTIAADATSHQTRSGEFARRGKEFIALYEKHLGRGETREVRGAGDFIDWDTAPGWPAGRQYVFHGKGTR